MRSDLYIGIGALAVGAGLAGHEGWISALGALCAVIGAALIIDRRDA